MGKSDENDEKRLRKYGVPIYGVAWLPPAALGSESAASRHVLLVGGGGEGKSGIPNALLLSAFNFESISLSDHPVAKLGTGSDLPYRIAVHPGSEGVICSFPKSCRLFEWQETKDGDKNSVSLKSSEKTFPQLEDVGQQLAMAFNSEGNILAVGGEDGKLRIFKWPSMETIFHDAENDASIKDLAFSPDGKFLVTVGRDFGRIWNLSTSTPVASLTKEKGEVFGLCRFSQGTDTNQVLYIVAMQDRGSSIVKWDTASWRRISSAFAVRDPICAFNVSPDEKLLALGTTQGDVLILSSSSMRVHTIVRKAHLGLVTALAFSEDSRALLSASLDSSTRVTIISEKKKEGSLWMIILIILLAIAVYYARNQGLLF